MKALPTGLATHLAQDTTTLCTCWRLIRSNGEKLGFTDHDNALIFDGTTFEAKTGYTGSEIESSLGLSIDNLDATGALESGRLDEGKLKAGDFDHAEIEIWRVNWQDVSQRILWRKGHLGEVTYGAGRFSAEVRGLAHLFNQTKGRLYQHGCDAELGDARCKVDLNDPTFFGSGTITAISENVVELSGFSSFVSDWFTHGVAQWITGANAGRVLRIKRHRRRSSIAVVSFWQEAAQAMAIGDQVVLRAGCDKQIKTCRTKFANAINYQGFPHMPGNDFVMQVASSDDANNNGGRRPS